MISDDFTTLGFGIWILDKEKLDPQDLDSDFKCTRLFKNPFFQCESRALNRSIVKSAKLQTFYNKRFSDFVSATCFETIWSIFFIQET